MSVSAFSFELVDYIFPNFFMEAHPKRVHFDEESASLSSHSLKVIVPHNNLH